MKHLARIFTILFVLALSCAALVGCGGGSSSEDSADTGTDSSADAGAQTAEGLTVTDAIDLPELNVQAGSMMVSDDDYIYFAYRSNEDAGGLYRMDRDFNNVEMLDRGSFSGLLLNGEEMYYVEGADFASEVVTYRYLNLNSLSGDEISQESYLEHYGQIDPAARFNMPDDFHGNIAVVDDKAYFVDFIGKLEGQEDESVPLYEYRLSSIDMAGNIEPTGVTWLYRGTQTGTVSAYGDYVLFSRPWHAGANRGEVSLEDATEPNMSLTGEERPECVPVVYNVKTGEQTLLLRDRGINGDVYPVCATAGVLFTSTYDDEIVDGSSVKFEYFSAADPIQDADDLVEGSTEAEAFVGREEAQAAAEEEALRNEPYGPGTSTLHLSAPEDKMASYRLVRMDGSTEFLVTLQPGETIDQSFPCGRYTLKTAEGTEWISDEEAFGSAGDYGSTDVYSFDDGGYYEIGGGTHGAFHSESAEGFTG